MPGPLLPDDDRAPRPRPGFRRSVADTAEDTATERTGLRPAPDPVPSDRPHPDARGDDLALQLPAWDLVPPAEFVVRHRRQR